MTLGNLADALSSLRGLGTPLTKLGTQASSPTPNSIPSKIRDFSEQTRMRKAAAYPDAGRLTSEARLDPSLFPIPARCMIDSRSLRALAGDVARLEGRDQQLARR